MDKIIKRLLALPRRRLLIIMTTIIMTLIFIIETLAIFLRVLLPPLPAMGESLLNVLFLSIATILTLYLILFRSWTRDINKRGPSKPYEKEEPFSSTAGSAAVLNS
jgi:hypothetical protein